MGLGQIWVFLLTIFTIGMWIGAIVSEEPKNTRTFISSRKRK